EVTERNLKGIRLTPSCPVLTHVLFADDTVVFGKASIEEASKVKEILARYSAVSGQRVNEEKSAVFFSKNTPEELCVATETFHFLIDRMMSKAANWKSLLLSQGGKEVLAKAVLQAIPSYVFSCFMLPDGLLKKMDGVVAKFWWTGDVNRRGIHWCAKDRLTSAKQVGGLGFRSFKEFNLSHLAKLCWRIIQQPEALWVRVLKALYFPRNDFISAKGHHRPSWIWGSIIKGREALLKGLRKHVGNGEETSLDEPWFPGAANFRCPTSGQEGRRIAEFIMQDTRQWDVSKLREIFAEHVVQEIRKLPIGPVNMRDKWIWHHDAKGAFTIKSCYRFLKKGGTGAANRPDYQQQEWKWLWRLSMPPKVKFFIWKVCSNLLATRENLIKRKCANNPICPMCSNEDESVFHLLFACERTKVVWRELQPGISPPTPQQQISGWFQTLLQNGQQERCIRAALCCWVIWKSRNEWCFQQVSPSEQGMKVRLYAEISLWECGKNHDQRISGAGNVDGEPRHQPHVDQEPRNHKWRFLCDGSFKGEIQEAGVGIIVVNPEGRIVDGVACHLLCRDSIVAEAYAVLIACKLATRGGVEAEVWSDCRQVARACVDTEEVSPWECSTIVEEIRELLMRTPLVSIVNCERRRVAVADNIAKKARDGRLEINWVERIVGSVI
ncbi:Putative ribonuclease H protein At1g65750, partial [Linum perenne]